MRRSELFFKYSIAEVATAVQKKLRYHTQRLAHWNTEAIAAEEDAKQSVRTVSHQVTGGNQIQAVMDPTKAQWLNTCQTKQATHRGMVEQYATWIECLPRAVDDKGNELVALVLNQDDARYFGLLTEKLEE